MATKSVSPKVSRKVVWRDKKMVRRLVDWWDDQMVV